MDKSTLLQRPDKGSGIVVLDRRLYIDGMIKLLSDESKFVDLNAKTPKLNQIESEVRDLVNELFNSGAVDEKQL